jgi:hypothetical protein
MSAVDTGAAVLVSTAMLLTPFHPLLLEQGLESLLFGILGGMEIN